MFTSFSLILSCSSYQEKLNNLKLYITIGSKIITRNKDAFLGKARKTIDYKVYLAARMRKHGDIVLRIILPKSLQPINKSFDQGKIVILGPFSEGY